MIFSLIIEISLQSQQENDKVNIYYIKDNAVQDEKIEGIVVRVDNKLYAKFIAKHFSTYAVAEELSTSGSGSITNPNTGDNLGLYIILGLSGLGALVKCLAML